MSTRDQQNRAGGYVLTERGWELDRNDKVDAPEPADEGPTPYAEWLKDDLVAEAQRRELEVEAPGNKPELVAALEADDEAEGT